MFYILIHQNSQATGSSGLLKPPLRFMYWRYLLFCWIFTPEALHAPSTCLPFVVSNDENPSIFIISISSSVFPSRVCGSRMGAIGAVVLTFGFKFPSVRPPNVVLAILSWNGDMWLVLRPLLELFGDLERERVRVRVRSWDFVRDRLLLCDLCDLWCRLDLSRSRSLSRSRLQVRLRSLSRSLARSRLLLLLRLFLPISEICVFWNLAKIWFWNVIYIMFLVHVA